MSIFAKYISQLFYFHPQIFFRTDSCTSFKKSFEYAGHCLRGVYKNGLICTFVRAGLRWTSNSHLPLLFLIFLCPESLNIFLHFHLLWRTECACPVYLKSFEIRIIIIVMIIIIIIIITITLTKNKQLPSLGYQKWDQK